jgi:hypothetical protein
VVYVATGTLATPTREQVAAIAGAMERLPGVRFIWSLPKACHRLLPEGMGEWAAGRARVLAWAPQQVRPRAEGAAGGASRARAMGQRLQAPSWGVRNPPPDAAVTHPPPTPRRC